MVRGRGRSGTTIPGEKMPGFTMNTLRTALYAVLVLLLVLVYQTWDREHPSVLPTTTSVAGTEGSTATQVLPAALQQNTALVAPTSEIAPTKVQDIQVTTD